MTLYQISGLGAGIEVFGKMKLHTSTVFIPWLVPENQKESIEHYAERMAENINTNETYYLMGVSFGGIICQEINRFLNPEKLFLISTAVSQKEIPAPMKIAAKVGLTKHIPEKGIEKAKAGTHYMFGAKRPQDKQFLNNIMDNINIDYLRWSTTQIGKWKNEGKPTNAIRFHGKKDKLFPAKNLSGVDYWLKTGHFASYTEGREISVIVNEIMASLP